MLIPSPHFTPELTSRSNDMQEAHEALYELHQDQEQTQAHLAAALAHQEQVSPAVNA